MRSRHWLLIVRGFGGFYAGIAIGQLVLFASMGSVRGALATVLAASLAWVHAIACFGAEVDTLLSRIGVDCTARALRRFYRSVGAIWMHQVVCLCLMLEADGVAAGLIVFGMMCNVYLIGIASGHMVIAAGRDLFAPAADEDVTQREDSQ